MIARTLRPDSKTKAGPAAGALVGIALISSAVLAQSPPVNNYKSFDVVPGVPVQLGFHATANKDCSPALLPTIRVLESPKLGTLSVQQGELTTDGVLGCPQLIVAARMLSYEAYKGETEIDRLSYEVTNPNGDVGIYQITINVGEGRRPAATARREAEK